jgi:hypothetical protein
MGTRKKTVTPNILQSRSRERRVDKNIKSCDLFTSNDDYVLTGIGWHPTTRTRSPLEASGIVEGLRRCMGCISKMRMCGSQVTCKLVEGIVTHQDSWGYIDYTVIRVEFTDGGAALRSVALSKNFLKVAEE